MRTVLLMMILLAAAGCEKTIHEVKTPGPSHAILECRL